MDCAQKKVDTMIWEDLWIPKGNPIWRISLSTAGLTHYNFIINDHNTAIQFCQRRNHSQSQPGRKVPSTAPDRTKFTQFYIETLTHLPNSLNLSQAFQFFHDNFPKKKLENLEKDLFHHFTMDRKSPVPADSTARIFTQ